MNNECETWNIPTTSSNKEERHSLAIQNAQNMVNNSRKLSSSSNDATNNMLKINNNKQQYSSLIYNENDIDFLCGLGGWRPKWLQLFANKQTFLSLFCLTSVLQGVYYTYFVSVLTTIEKLYQIPSQTTGFIMSSTEIGQISGALLLTYYGGQGHRPRWISSGMIVFACAALLCSTPHYLFGSHPVSGTVQSHNTNLTVSSSQLPLCYNDADFNDTAICSSSDVSIRRSRITNSVLGIFSVSLLFIGLGTTAVNTLGIPYIDDNVAQKASPLYFGITIGVRILGPVCGFLLGSLCTSIPADFPFYTSNLSSSDTNWIGAWWLGLFLVGISLLITSFPMMIFPRHLPTPDPSSYRHQQQQQSILEQNERILQHKHNNDCNTTNYEVVTYEPNNTFSSDSENHVNEKLIELKAFQKKKNKSDRPTLKGFTTAVVRLLKNDILLFRTASSVLHILPISGLYTFLPKYLESQFQLSATYANLIAGLAGILIMGVGIFSSGTFMRKYKPSAKFVARWIAFAAIAYVIGMISLMFLGCPSNQFAGFPISKTDRQTTETTINPLECSANCNCPSGRFEPICLPNGVTYISPCLAGCKTFHNETDKYYSDCSCLSSSSLSSISTTQTQQVAGRGNNSYSDLLSSLDIVRPGLCSLKCNTLTLYIIIFSITVLIHSTSEVGSMLLTLRCVQPQDKAMALGFISFATSLFGNVPCPILYGSIVDSTCLFWEEDGCEKRGACRLYDSTSFRQWFHGTTAFIMFLAFCIDLVVCYKADGIQFHEEEPTEEKNEENEKDGVVMVPNESAC